LNRLFDTKEDIKKFRVFLDEREAIRTGVRNLLSNRIMALGILTIGAFFII